MSAPIVLTADSFSKEVKETRGVIMVDFWASWCGPCRMIAPLIDRLADEFSGRIRVGKIDIDTAGELAANLGIMSVPTLILFSDGTEIERIVGLKSYEALKALVSKHL